jgi:uncharacterized membrane protein
MVIIAIKPGPCPIVFGNLSKVEARSYLSTDHVPCKTI